MMSNKKLPIKRMSVEQQIDKGREVEILGKNVLTKDEYLEELKNTKQNIREQIVNFAVLIKGCLNNTNMTQRELADELGMNESTISRWLQIGNHRMIRNYSEKLPMSFSALYRLVVLEKEYIKHYNEKQGQKRFDSLFQNNIVTSGMIDNDITDLIYAHQKRTKLLKKRQTEKIFHSSDTRVKEYEDKVYNLRELTETKKWFNTIVLVPTNEQLTRWKELNMSSYIDEDFPITLLRNVTHTSSITFLMKVEVSKIDIALKCLSSWGFNYRDTYLPPQDKKTYESGIGKFVIIRGERGVSPFKEKSTSIKSSKTKDIMSYAEEIGNKPFVLIGEKEDDENWTICID